MESWLELHVPKAGLAILPNIDSSWRKEERKATLLRTDHSKYYFPMIISGGILQIE